MRRRAPRALSGAPRRCILTNYVPCLEMKIVLQMYGYSLFVGDMFPLFLCFFTSFIHSSVGRYYKKKNLLKYLKRSYMRITPCFLLDMLFCRKKV